MPGLLLPHLSRRRFLAGAGGALALATLPAASPPAALADFRTDPFLLGVAAGDPAPDGFVLWTRLAPFPFEPEKMGPVAYQVGWEIATDEAFKTIVQSGTERAPAHLAHSVHVEVSGLEPGKLYFYRFILGSFVSRVGRAKTLPAAGAALDRLRLAFCSCAHYEQGFFSGYRYIAEDQPDLIVHLGDYIYENSWGRRRVRLFDAKEAETLDEYRRRYAEYRTDPDLQRAHAAAVWAVTWDDHEVDNDYANDQSENAVCAGASYSAADFLKRRAAAYQAYYEHMPLRASSLLANNGLKLYRALDYGALARIVLLDERQWRSDHACTAGATIDGCDGPKKMFRGPGGGEVIPSSEPWCQKELNDPKRTMLGTDQEAWFARAVAGPKTTWTAVAQGVFMARLNQGTAEAEKLWSDGWDGYPGARTRLLSAMRRANVQNPVFLSGDVHAFWVNDIPTDPRNPASPVYGSEFVCSAIAAETFDRSSAMNALNPRSLFHDGKTAGYVLMDFTKDRVDTRLVGLVDIADPRTARKELVRYVVEAGKPGAKKA